ncbi:hypothetical protein PIB30_033306 [Stylosanthes scabra]|uniref:Uncharacterized protein n=1 Tax=Stylosanthes scabra TaxID=79078 RepID=A0ABU6TEB2_9FABA|nr:hypothetical protein [Stylosanthes scabra]
MPCFTLQHSDASKLQFSFKLKRQLDTYFLLAQTCLLVLPTLLRSIELSFTRASHLDMFLASFSILAEVHCSMASASRTTLAVVVHQRNSGASAVWLVVKVSCLNFFLCVGGNMAQDGSRGGPPLALQERQIKAACKVASST